MCTCDCSFWSPEEQIRAPELELWVLWTLMWVLGIEPGFSGVTASALNHWAVSLAPSHWVFTVLFKPCHTLKLTGSCREGGNNADPTPWDLNSVCSVWDHGVSPRDFYAIQAWDLLDLAGIICKPSPRMRVTPGPAHQVNTSQRLCSAPWVTSYCIPWVWIAVGIVVGGASGV